MIVVFKKDDLEKPEHLVNLGVPVMEKFEILKLVADQAEKEFNRNWARYSILLYANIGLLVSLSMTMAMNALWTSAIPSAIGMTVSIAWVRINLLSHHHTRQWQADVTAQVEADKTLHEWFKGKDLLGAPWCFSSTRAQFYIDLVPYAFLVVWAMVFLSCLFALLFGLWRH